MRWMLLLLLACAKQTTPVEIAGNGSIGALPAASSAPSSVDAAATSIAVDAHGQLQIAEPILFAVGKDQLLPESSPTLQRVADFMHARRDVLVLRIEGHSDSMGSAAYNLTLTQKRAEAIAKWLIDHGVECTRLEAVGYGQTRPIAPNNTEEYRRKNRRMDFFIADSPTTHTVC